MENTVLLYSSNRSLEDLVTVPENSSIHRGSLLFNQNFTGLTGTTKEKLSTTNVAFNSSLKQVNLRQTKSRETYRITQ